jgi:hypothetical protein
VNEAPQTGAGGAAPTLAMPDVQTFTRSPRRIHMPPGPGVMATVPLETAGWAVPPPGQTATAAPTAMRRPASIPSKKRLSSIELTSLLGIVIGAARGRLPKIRAAGPRNPVHLRNSGTARPTTGPRLGVVRHAVGRWTGCKLELELARLRDSD